MGSALLIDGRRLSAFSTADRFFMRDCRGRSLSPSLTAEPATGLVHARGPFVMRYDYTVSRAQGVRFVEVTGDENPIHREEDIVAGALTASKMIIPLETLLPNFKLRSARIRFTGLCRYDRRTSSNFLFRQGRGDGKLSIDIKACQGGDVIASGQIGGSIQPTVAEPGQVKDRNVNVTNLRRVQSYFHSIGIESRAYLEKGERRDYTYPLGFIMSLPSAALVRQMHGHGGMLNLISMEFDGQEKIPITGKELPSVKLQDKGQKLSFHRILTDIIHGVVTYYRGMAIVNPRAAGT